MRPYLPRIALASASLAACLLLAACGSGSTKTIATPEYPESSLFHGQWRWVNLGAEQLAPEEVSTGWGTLTTTETTASSFGYSNHDGMVDLGGVGSFGGNTYYVEADRRFVNGFYLNEFSAGGITQAGDVAILASVNPGNIPWLGLFGRRGAGLGQADVSGTYQAASFRADEDNDDTGSAWGTITFDGAGGGNGELTANVEGVIGMPTMGGVTYTVADDGAMTLNLGSYEVTGIVAAGGEFILLAGGSESGTDPGLLVLTRRGGTFSDADLTGAYFMVGMFQEVGTESFTSFTGSLEADGAGAAEIAGSANTEGVVVVTPPDPISTMVAADGTVTVMTASGDTLTGAMSSDHRFVLLSGPTNAGSDPLLFLLMR